MAGAVQHGASTLPSNAFGNFPRIETAEIHLATNFQNIVFDHSALPAELRQRMYRWLDENAQSERKPEDSAEQFYYKARKKAIGPFKQEMWNLPAPIRQQIGADLEKTFAFLFEQLRVTGTGAIVGRFVTAPALRVRGPRPTRASSQRTIRTRVSSQKAGGSSMDDDREDMRDGASDAGSGMKWFVLGAGRRVRGCGHPARPAGGERTPGAASRAVRGSCRRARERNWMTSAGGARAARRAAQGSGLRVRGRFHGRGPRWPMYQTRSAPAPPARARSWSRSSPSAGRCAAPRPRQMVPPRTTSPLTE